MLAWEMWLRRRGGGQGGRSGADLQGWRLGQEAVARDLPHLLPRPLASTCFLFLSSTKPMLVTFLTCNDVRSLPLLYISILSRTNTLQAESRDPQLQPCVRGRSDRASLTTIEALLHALRVRDQEFLSIFLIDMFIYR